MWAISTIVSFPSTGTPRLRKELLTPNRSLLEDHQSQLEFLTSQSTIQFPTLTKVTLEDDYKLKRHGYVNGRPIVEYREVKPWKNTHGSVGLNGQFSNFEYICPYDNSKDKTDSAKQGPNAKEGFGGYTDEETDGNKSGASRGRNGNGTESNKGNQSKSTKPFCSVSKPTKVFDNPNYISQDYDSLQKAIRQEQRQHREKLISKDFKTGVFQDKNQNLAYRDLRGVKVVKCAPDKVGKADRSSSMTAAEYNVFNRDFKRSEKVWKPSDKTKKLIVSEQFNVPCYMPNGPAQRVNRDHLPIWKSTRVQPSSVPCPPILNR